MSIRSLPGTFKASSWILASLVALSGVAMAADGTSPPSDGTLVDLDYGASCVTNDDNYAPTGTEAAVSLDEHRARAGIDGMFCAAENGDGYGFVASHENGSRAMLAGEHTAVHATVQEGVAGVFENTYYDVGVRLADDVGMLAYAEHAYCAAGVNDEGFAVGVEGGGQDVGVRGLTHDASGRGVLGENHQTGARGALGDGAYGVSATSYDAPAAFLDGRGEGKEDGGTAAHMRGDLYLDGAYRGRLGASHEGAPFPRPAFDSGWVYFSPGDAKTLDPGIGGDVDNYRIEVLEKSRSGLSIRPAERSYGHAPFGLAKYGSTWSLDTGTKKVRVVNIDNRKTGAVGAKYIRVRIWYIL